eukprot:TRINITY_DN1183_c0_g1_i1.p1 TRINITY_DN1183_c0_g1~~TRINITY_DN1183_c0_g1_i1.p1  ORF type:complete len:66 (-),score=2.21 TRINITY_DN1183_c0_g1_i1:300-497(-)
MVRRSKRVFVRKTCESTISLRKNDASPIVQTGSYSSLERFVPFYLISIFRLNIKYLHNEIVDKFV